MASIEDINKDMSVIGQDSSGIVMTVSDAEKMNQFTIKTLEYLVNERKMAGVYVTINRPYSKILSELQAKNIDTNSVIFIDALTKTVGGSAINSEKCLYLNHINDLTELGIIITSAMKALSSKERYFVLIDSITTMLIYNDPQAVSKFLHFITAKFRLLNANGIFIGHRTEKLDSFYSQITVFCDRVLNYC
jgi:archaellum biogenesis ATPase FlaH